MQDVITKKSNITLLMLILYHYDIVDNSAIYLHDKCGI